MASNHANIPVEMIATDYPIRIERYGFVPDTGGPGRFRGGLSLVREDLLDDRISLGHARSAYGVVFERDTTIDDDATRELRAKHALRAGSGRGATPAANEADA